MKSARAQDLCQGCYEDLPWLTSGCARCGRPLPHSAPQCGACIAAEPLYDRTVAVFEYQSPVSELIGRLKFGGELTCMRVLGELLFEKISAVYQEDTWPEVVVPMPLHRRRLRERGFNQAYQIAKPLKRHVPMLLNWAVRVRATHAQAELSGVQRRLNVKNAFAVRFARTLTHVAVVDDVMTTGHTVSALSRCLKAQGVERIDVWCLARASFGHH